MSAPAQNALGPAPVNSSARVPVFAAASIAAEIASIICALSAFSASGRFSVMTENSSRRVSSNTMAYGSFPFSRST